MKLTESQIEALYKFTRKHYVEYYDVQTELVDHLANDIEKIWEAQPHLTFEEARDKSFKKFGVFGFMDAVEKKEWQMTKKYLKLVLRFVKEWFRLPKIILSVTLLFAFYHFQKLSYAYDIYNVIFFSVLLAQITFIFINAKRLKKKFKETGKKFLFENVIATQGLGNITVFLFYFFNFPGSDNEGFLVMHTFWRFLSAFLLLIIILQGYITLFVIPKKAEELLKETYPEYQFS